jgi:osmotically inducible protein OsmC
LEVTATVSLEDGTIKSSHLDLKAKIPGIAADKFKECADDAKANCPVSKLLNAEITLDASLA